MDAPFPVGMMDDIRRFFVEVHPTLKPGLDYYPEVFATQHFFPLQRQRELAEMMRLARSIDPVTVMEIGADKGGGLYHWCMCLPTVRNVIACEIRGTPYATEFELAFPDIEFWWGKDSQSLALERLVRARGIHGYPIDVLFIDGDKQKFYEDYKLYRPLMSEGGLIFVHDFRDYGPSTAWKRIKSENPGKWSEILDATDYHEAKGGTPHSDWLLYWKGESCGVGVIHV